MTIDRKSAVALAFISKCYPSHLKIQTTFKILDAKILVKLNRISSAAVPNVG